MEKNRKNIDDLFKEELGNYAETPPPAVWDALEQRLDAKPPIAGQGASRWSRYFFIASAVAVLGVALLKLSGSGSAIIAGIAATDNTTSPKDNTPSANTVLTTGYPHNTAITSSASPLNSSSSANSTTSSVQEQNLNQPLSPGKATGTINNNASTISNTASNAAQTIAAASNDMHSRQGRAVNNLRQEDGYQMPDNSNSTGSKATATAGKRNTHANQGFTAKAGNLSATKKPGSKHHGKHAGNILAANSRSHAHSASAGNGEEEDGSNKADDNYNISAPKIASSVIQNIPGPAAEEAQPLPGTFKEPTPDPVSETINKVIKGNTALKGVPTPKVSRYEMGVKAGYETGTNKTTGKKVVVSPYVSYKIADKFSVMLQPSVKFAHVAPQALTGTQSFYKENNDSAYSVICNPVILAGGSAPIGYVDTVKYIQSHDSIVKSYTSGGTYTEFELPVLLKYSIAKNISAYGGFTMNYSKYIGVTEHTYSQTVVSTRAGGPVYVEAENTQPIISPVSSVITYTGNLIYNYKGPTYATTPGGLFRIGYMLGFSYEYSNRWLFDVLMQQSSVKSATQGGYNTNAPFAAPYFRITLGYKILR